MDVKLASCYFRISVGVAVKTFGYFLIAAGIFLSLADTGFALKVVYAGAGLVALGWVMFVHTLRSLNSASLSPKKFSAHLVRGTVEEGETVTVRGKISTSTEPKKVRVLLDGIEVGRVESGGEFVIHFAAPKRGKYTVEVRISGYSEPKRLKLQVVSREEMRKIRRTEVLAYVLISVLILVLVAIVVIVI